MTNSNTGPEEILTHIRSPFYSIEPHSHPGAEYVNTWIAIPMND